MAFQVLHSSDWHLGKRLYHKSRETEFRYFLDWLCAQLQDIDLLLIAGDVFDSNTPPVWAQELYYQFLYRASRQCEIVVCAGNHDSALFLEAPRTLLRALRVHVVGNPSALLCQKWAQHLADSKGDLKGGLKEGLKTDTGGFPPELIPIYGPDEGNLQALVCALPYLKDSYLRSSSWGENQKDKEQKLQQGIANYYRVLLAEAQRFLRQQEPVKRVPVLAMGHLFAGGANTVENDGVRELYIGSLGHFPVQLLPVEFDYVALGHIHQAQKLQGTKRADGSAQEIRYSGAPLVFSFGERGKKEVLRLEFSENHPLIHKITVPVWQPLKKLLGDGEALRQGITALDQEVEWKDGQASDPGIWLELEHTGGLTDAFGLREQLQEWAGQHNMEILRYRSQASVASQVGMSAQGGKAGEGKLASTVELLVELSPEEVFRRRLEQHGGMDSPKKLKNQSENCKQPDALGQPASQVVGGAAGTGPNSEPGEETDRAFLNADLEPQLWQLYRSLLQDILIGHRDSADADQANISINLTEGDTLSGKDSNPDLV